ncbi:MAG: histidine--tRNA ligase [Clostridia bacterium]|nr:histidine--tRNA ligase [Clostridia bacterium]
MNKVKPRTLSGFVELLPQDQILFNKVKDTIRNSYEKFGFVPLDTPILEYSDVLLAKAGGETEKQIYRFNKGDTDISMRFDLTVPLAKFVAMNYGQLAFPFRRYQIGKVYRGERTQKGRFREFYQADIDIIGDEALELTADAELVSVIYATFKDLGFTDFTIKINNRKILNGLFEGLGLKDKAVDILRIIDKIEKIGEKAVIEMLLEVEVQEEKIEQILSFLKISGNNEEKILKMEKLDINSEDFLTGVKELREVVQLVNGFGVPDKNYEIDTTIARGLDYYTGTVYETVLNEHKEIGSVCSGGRYENLAEYYTNKKLPGVGISIGLSRLFYKLEEAGVIKASASTCADVMVIPMIEDISYALKIATSLRENGVNTEVNYSKKSLKAMLNYANRIKVLYVVFVGEDEVKSSTVTLKNMTTGEQETMTLQNAIDKVLTK